MTGVLVFKIVSHMMAPPRSTQRLLLSLNIHHNYDSSVDHYPAVVSQRQRWHRRHELASRIHRVMPRCNQRQVKRKPSTSKIRNTLIQLHLTAEAHTATILTLVLSL